VVSVGGRFGSRAPAESGHVAASTRSRNCYHRLASAADAAISNHERNCPMPQHKPVKNATEWGGGPRASILRYFFWVRTMDKA
jgi:hypothetical protein